MNNEEKDKGEMTVEEAGHMGGQKERELVEEGKEAESEEMGDEEDMSENEEMVKENETEEDEEE